VEQGAAFTTEQAIRLTGVSRRRLTYWLERGIVGAEADVIRGRRHVRLWSFTNLLEIRVALWLRDRVSLQYLGRVVHALRDHGLTTPLAEVRVAVVEAIGRKGLSIVVQGPDGAWEEPLSGQLVMELVLPLGRFREELSNAVERDRRQNRRPGQVEQHRGQLGSAAVFAGTRVPVAAVQRLHAAGWDTNRILAEYPALTATDVRAALKQAERAG